MLKENNNNLVKEFNDSYNEWYSWCMVPLTHEEMLMAVACGDGEVSLIKEDDWPEDFFFKWNKKREERKETYMQFDKGDCVVILEDGIATLTKVIEINDDYLKLEGYEDKVHSSKIHNIELAIDAFKYNEADQLIEDAESYNSIKDQMFECMNMSTRASGFPDTEIVIDCLMCEGTGEDGHDRCFPPNPYLCDFCEGTGSLILQKSKTKNA